MQLEVAKFVREREGLSLVRMGLGEEDGFGTPVECALECLVLELSLTYGKDLDNLAKIFGVPTEVCHFRLTSLQLI